MIAGKVVECVKHPNADRLKLTSIDLGNNQISEIVWCAKYRKRANGPCCSRWIKNIYK